jgi:hypothetical protein
VPKGNSLVSIKIDDTRTAPGSGKKTAETIRGNDTETFPHAGGKGNPNETRQPSKINGRDGRIRTGDPLLPKQMRYQAAPRPDIERIQETIGGEKPVGTPVPRARKPSGNPERSGGPGLGKRRATDGPVPPRRRVRVPARSGSYPSAPMSLSLAMSCRIACPRWLIRFFSSVEISAIVLPQSFTRKTGS